MGLWFSWFYMLSSLELQQRILLSSLAFVNELEATSFLADGNVQFAGIFL